MNVIRLDFDVEFLRSNQYHRDIWWLMILIVTSCELGYNYIFSPCKLVYKSSK